MNANYPFTDETAAGTPIPATGAGEPEGIAADQVGKNPAKPAKKGNKSLKAVQEFLGGGYLSKGIVTGNLVFILYLGFLAMAYIGNTYYTEKKFKRIERIKNELKELRYQYITTKSALMFQGRQSEISKRALGHGLKETTRPPYKILYSAEMLNQKRK